ncbi:hypothetical protein [Microbulbifer halophilus]
MAENCSCVFCIPAIYGGRAPSELSVRAAHPTEKETLCKTIDTPPKTCST